MIYQTNLEIPTLHTHRLTLRALTETDAKRVQLLAGTHAVASVTTNVAHPYLDGMAEAWIHTHAEAYRKGEGLTFGIFLTKENILTGVISLMGLQHPARKSEIGYWIGVEYWGQGYCTEAARAVVQFAFQESKMNKITSRHMAMNPASGKVMQKIGMKYEGTLRQENFKDGIYHDMVVYGILASEAEAP